MTCRYCLRRIQPGTGHHPTVVGPDPNDPFKTLWRCQEKGVALALVTGCPDCGGEVRRDSTAQLPLIRHGGFGEIVEQSTLSCPRCGWTLDGGKRSLNPRGVA